jgi:hypothetical protein
MPKKKKKNEDNKKLIFPTNYIIKSIFFFFFQITLPQKRMCFQTGMLEPKKNQAAAVLSI